MLQASVPDRLRKTIELARTAQADWAALSVRRRCRWLSAFRAWLASHSSQLCETINHEVGKPREECLAAELLPLASGCAHLSRIAPGILAPRRARGTPWYLAGGSDHVHRRPRGVVGIIGTWNYPLVLSGTQIAQALVAGNAVIFKPSEKTPETCRLLADGIAGSGLPRGLVQSLDAEIAAGEELVDSSVDHVVFTGSRAVGSRIASALAPRLVSSTLELSGHDALFLLPGGDPIAAARAAWFGTIANSGRTCLATRRCLVASSLMVPFRDEIARLALEVPPLELGKPAGFQGRIDHAKSLAMEAVSMGARWLGKSQEKPPFLVENVSDRMRIWREDCFAPLLAIMECADERSMIKADLACPFALGAAVFGSPGPARSFLTGLRAGMVTVNDVLVAAGHPDTPIGGSGSSGWGATQGAEGLLEMTVHQVVRVSHGSFRPHYELAVPGHPDMGNMLEALLQAGHAGGIRARIVAAMGLPGHALRWWRSRQKRQGEV